MGEYISYCRSTVPCRMWDSFHLLADHAEAYGVTAHHFSSQLCRLLFDVNHADIVLSVCDFVQYSITAKYGCIDSLSGAFLHGGME